MTEERIAQLEALCTQAEKGPWVDDEEGGISVQWGEPLGGMFTRNDAEFVAEARTALPEALAEVRRLKAEQVFVRTMLDQVEEGALTPTAFHARIAHATSQEIQSLYESLRGTIGELEQLGTHSEEVSL